MAQFTVSQYEPHPEGGPFEAVITDCVERESEWQGKKSTRLQWVLETNAPTEGSNPAKISYFTGMNFGRPDAQGKMRAHLRVLMDALGIRCPETPEEAAEFDTQDVMGAKCMIMVVHEEVDGAVRDRIASMRPKKAAKPKPAPKPAPPPAETESEDDDPFADQ